MDPLKKNVLLETNRKIYKSMDPLKNNVLLETKRKIYKSMDPVKKKVLLERKRKKYKSMDPVKKKVLLGTKKYKLKKCKLSMDLNDLDDYISRFCSKIKEGPYYICSVCNRLLYRTSLSCH